MMNAARTVDLAQVRAILQDAMDTADNLDGVLVDDTTLEKKKAEAELNRRLLNLADALGLASSLVRNAYWHGKGEMNYDL
jgi:hypothetical protein